MYSTTDLFPCLIDFSASRAACVLSRGANRLLNAISKSAYAGKGSPPAQIVSRYGRAQLRAGPFMRFIAAFIHLRSSARHPAGRLPLRAGLSVLRLQVPIDSLIPP